jgi:hypothetical protein
MKRDNAAWMRGVLLAAVLCNVLWGAIVVLFPLALFRSLGMELDNPPTKSGEPMRARRAT